MPHVERLIVVTEKNSFSDIMIHIRNSLLCENLPTKCRNFASDKSDNDLWACGGFSPRPKEGFKKLALFSGFK